MAVGPIVLAESRLDGAYWSQLRAVVFLVGFVLLTKKLGAESPKGHSTPIR